MSADLRDIVELKTYAGLTFQQISQVTGLPQGTVATRYRSALAKMQDLVCEATMIDDDIEQLLGRLTPRGVCPELRPQVLAAVASQLEAEPASRWPRRSALAVAASLLLGIGMNIWASKSAERRLAELFGPPPVSKQAMELADAMEKTTDAETARWVYQRLAASRPSAMD